MTTARQAPGPRTKQAADGRRRPGRTASRSVVDVSLLEPEGDFDQRVRFLGREVRIRRIGTGGSVDDAVALVRTWSANADAVAVSGMDDVRATGHYDGDLKRLDALQHEQARVFVTTGDHIRDVLQEWSVRQLQAQLPGYFTNARVVVLGGENHRVITRVLREYTANITVTNPALLDVVGELEVIPVLGHVAKAVLRPARRIAAELHAPLNVPGPVGHVLAHRAARECDVVVATYEELVDFGLEDLHGKAVLTTSISDDRLAELARRDVDLVLDTTPQPFPVTVDAALLEALIALTASGSGSHEPSEDELLDKISAAGLQPRVLQPNGPRRKSRFAFVIHPLTQRQFENVEPLRTISRVAPGVVMGAVEKAVAYSPPFIYSHVTGITSPTGAEAEGWLITVGGTPKQLLAHPPEFTYAKLLEAAEISKRLGAQIMGLGAFTKVVGDAGATVAKQAPLPVTTGNSYSASAALWAGHEALRRLGLVDVDEDGVMRGRTMVVGATGSIGAACARLLALVSDELWLVSPETAKLLTLKHVIERDEPRAKVHVAATPGHSVADMDLIVTATSAAGKRILDIMDVKPGCVITDVARPLDLSAEDVARRPDVLVIESGEIEMPGELHMRAVGLPKGVAYACLAETVVLALEGRYETFTVGRDIDLEKVKEIYRLGLKHGMKLAAISGVDGVFTAEDFARTRELALAARARAATH